MSDNNQKPSSDDHSVGLSLSLTETGVDVKVQSRFVAALDWLGGGWLTKKGGKQQAQIANDAQDLRHQQQLRDVIFEHGLNRLQQSPDLMDTLAGRAIAKHARVEENTVKVLMHAREQVILLSPPATSTTESAESPDTGIPVNDGKAGLDEDWLSAFQHYASMASTERTQLLWGRILAGELIQPNSISIAAFRVLFEMSRDAADLFERCAPFIFDHTIILSAQDGGVDLEFKEATKLTDEGLLFTHEMNGQITYDARDKLPWMIYGDFSAVALAPLNSMEEMPFRGYRLTRAGKAISGIVKRDETILLKRMAESKKNLCSSATLYPVIDKSETNMSYNTEEGILLWRR